MAVALAADEPPNAFSHGGFRKRLVSLVLLGKRASVRGWYSGTAVDSEDTLLFSQLNDIASMNEIFPLDEAQAAYDRMMSGKARFRVVLKIDS